MHNECNLVGHDTTRHDRGNHEVGRKLQVFHFQVDPVLKVKRTTARRKMAKTSSRAGGNGGDRYSRQMEKHYSCKQERAEKKGIPHVGI